MTYRSSAVVPGPALTCAANRTCLEIVPSGGAIAALLVPLELIDGVPDLVGVRDARRSGVFAGPHGAMTRRVGPDDVAGAGAA